MIAFTVEDGSQDCSIPGRRAIARPVRFIRWRVQRGSMPRREHLLMGTAVFSGVYAGPLLWVLVELASLITTPPARRVGGPASGGPGPAVLVVKEAFVGCLALAAVGLGAANLADEEWSPDPRLYGGLGLLSPLSPLVATVYPYRRWRHAA